MTVAKIILIGIAAIYLSSCNEKRSDEVSIRFNMPHCQKLADGTTKCSMKKLPERAL